MQRCRCTLILARDNLGGRARDHRLLASSVTAAGVAAPPPPPCVSGKFRDFWRRGVLNTRWGLHDVGVGENEEI